MEPRNLAGFFFVGDGRGPVYPVIILKNDYFVVHNKKRPLFPTGIADLAFISQQDLCKTSRKKKSFLLSVVSRLP